MKSYPLTSSHWGTYRAAVENGKLTALHPFEEDADPSAIGAGIVDVLDGPSRIQSPMVRQSYLQSGPGSANDKRGAEPFVAVSWEQATQLVATELDRVRKQYGNAAIYAGSYGWASAGRFHHAQSQLRRFMNGIGGCSYSVNTYSFASAEVLVPHVLGDFWGYLPLHTSWPCIAEHSDLVVAFGGIPVKNGQINAGGVGRHIQNDGLLAAAQAGVAFVNISPIASDMQDFLKAEWLMARPSTDTAMLLAMAYTLYTEKLYDADFMDRYTVGLEQLLPYLLGDQDGVAKDPDWAAAISGVSAERIRQLTRRMANCRCMLSVSWSLTRQDHGEQVYWAAITVAALLGQIGLPGGGIGFGYSATNSIGAQATRIAGASLPQGDNPVTDYIPVARISDMLLHPGEAFDFNGQRLHYPDVHLVYWAGGNPFHHHQDLNRMLRAWQKPDSIIVHEWCWNALAKHADIVLPCTTTLEREDIALSPRDPYIVYMNKVVEPPFEAKNDHVVFCARGDHTL